MNASQERFSSSALTTLGEIGLVTALVLAFQRRWSLLLGWAVALIGAGELSLVLKGIFRTHIRVL